VTANALHLQGLAVGGGAPLTAAVADGDWQVVRHHDPDLLLDAVGGLHHAPGGITLDGLALHGTGPLVRARAGLGLASGRLPPLPGLRVRDVLLLSSPPQPGLAWRAAVGLRRHRARLADVEALARGLAGRLGVSGWTDEPAVGLPDVVEALVDLGRVVAARPRAIVWRAPDWLDGEEAGAVRGALEVEHAIGGWAVLEVRQAARRPTRGPLIIEVQS
jgi:hypothetical protein